MPSLPIRRQGEGRGGAKGNRHLLNYICICSCSNRLNFTSACSYLSGDLEQLLSTHVVRPYKSGGKTSPWAPCSPKLSITAKGQAINCISILEKMELCEISMGNCLQLGFQGYMLQN